MRAEKKSNRKYRGFHEKLADFLNSIKQKHPDSVTSHHIRFYANINNVQIDKLSLFAEGFDLITISQVKVGSRDVPYYSMREKGIQYCHEWCNYVERLKCLELGEIVLTKLRNYKKSK